MSNTIGFDESFYLSQNPDVAAAVSRGVFASGAQHFQLNGRFEGRNPNAFFNTSFYLGTYPDVARAGVNPLTHFLTNGAAEGRFANANEKGAIDLNNNGGADDFNESAYRTTYTDVDAAIKAGTFKNAYQHFVQFGQFEGRVATLSNGTTITGPFSNSGSAPNAGTTFTLTTNADGPGAPSPAANTQGTANDDTFNATDATLNSSDNLVGGAGNDTLSVRVTTAGVTTAPQSSSVENVVINNITTGAFTLNAASMAGVTNVVSKDSNAASTTTVLGVAANATLALDNADGTTRFNVLGAANRTGTSDAITVNVANGSGTATNTAGLVFRNDANSAVDATFETLNLVTSGAASFVTVGGGSGANLSTINVSGSGSLTLTEAANFANVRTVDATKLTGTAGLDINLSGSTQNVTFTGGGGNDTVRLGATLATTDVINGGAGRDAIGITNGATLVTGLQVTNIEILDIGGATASTFNASRIAGIDTLRVSTATAGAVSVTDLAKTATVEIQAALGGDLSLTQAGAGAGSPNDVITINLGGPAAITTGGGLVITDIETVNLNSVTTGTGDITNTLASLTDTVATTVNLNASTAALTVTDLTTVAAVRIDASASVKAVSITTGSDAFTSTGGTAILLGQAADTLDLANATAGNTGAAGTLAGADFVITGGKGGDLITLSNVAATIDVITINAGDSFSGVTTTGARQYDTVNGFAAGTNSTAVDLIDVRSFGFTTTERAVNQSAATATADGTIAAASQTNFFGTGAGRAGIAVVTAADIDPGVATTAGVFVYIDANRDGQLNSGDQMLALAGVTATTIDATDFLFA